MSNKKLIIEALTDYRKWFDGGETTYYKIGKLISHLEKGGSL